MGPRPRGRGIGHEGGHRARGRQASMGPRPRGRGIRKRPLKMWRLVCASMGPRPRGRGIAIWVARLPHALSASMGPRPRGRGIEAITRWNAAAQDCFNGAATARSRNYGSAILIQLGDLWLQWGRDRAVAELSRPLGLGVQLSQASMGPRPRGRGIPTVIAMRRHSDLCFNGAATARSRNFADHRPKDQTANASMGPRPRGRGISTKRTRDGAVCLASMGPRPRGRGITRRAWRCARCVSCFNGAATARSRNCGTLVAGILESDKLQWGRDRAVAELALANTVNAYADPLQWGRDRAVAELVQEPPDSLRSF